MRTRTFLFVAALLAGWVTAAGAQQATGQQPGEETPTPTPWHITLQNWLDAGVRITDTSGDTARFERYRDPRTGPFLDRFRFEKETGPGIFSLALDNIGYRDQRLFGQFNVPGKVRFSAEWNQIPLFMSVDTHSPYNPQGAAVQTLPAGAQQAVQSGANVVTYYNGLNLGPFDTRNRRDTLTLNFLYTPTTNLGINFNLSSASRSGDQPWSVTFGFGQASDVTTPVDTRTTDLDVGAEWANDRGMARISYDGSWFTNHDESLTIDNPLTATDSRTASARARYALWPTNHSNTVTGAAAATLPGHSRVAGSLAIGNWLQDTPLLPMTINSALPSAPLPRSSAEGDIRRIGANVSFTTRPTNVLGITARYRFYDFNDRTPEFAAATLIEYDTTVEAGSDELVPAHFSNRYNTFEAEADISAWRSASVSAGYRFNQVGYTDREVSNTRDNSIFASIDSASLGMVSFHGNYEHARRRASDFNGFALTDLPDSGEYAGLRRYDIADRDRDLVTAMAQVMPVANLAVSGSVTVTHDNYPNGEFSSADSFGLQSSNSQGYAIFLDATPRDTVTVGGGYGYQLYKTNQRSRQANPGPQQLDPNRDWTTNEDEKVHYIAANVELAQLFDKKTALRVTYDYNRAESPYIYSVGPSLTTPLQLPPVFNRWHTFTADARYFFRSNVAAGVTYWYEHYSVDDFAMGSNVENNNAVPGIILVGYGYRPYTANSVWFRVLYLF